MNNYSYIYQRKPYILTEQPYKVEIEIFEGPIDLLVHLIQKNKMDIHNISISEITDQYLAYLELLKNINIDFGGDFIVMASTLTQIKSKSLLPKHDPKDENEDPRMEIIRPILEYLQMKAAAKDLAERDRLEEDVFLRQPENDFEFDDEPEEIMSVDIIELIDAFQKLLILIPDDSINVIKKGISVKERIAQLIDVLEVTPDITFEQCFGDDPIKADMVVTFLSLLEMVKLNIIRIIQEKQSGLIKIIYI